MQEQDVEVPRREDYGIFTMILSDFQQSSIERFGFITAIGYVVGPFEKPRSHARSAGIERKTVYVHPASTEIASDAETAVVGVHHEHRRIHTRVV
jgi:hypothetical protein